MEWIELGELADIELGKTPARKKPEYWNGENTWVSIADISGKYICDSKEGITDLAIEETNIKEVPENTVIMSFKLSIGKRSITSKKIYTNEAIAAFHIKDKDRLDTEYLYYVLGYINLLENTDKSVKGQTLNKQKLQLLKIPVPPMEIQKQIVEVLDEAQILIDKREKQIKLLDDLIDSIFYEMFGDPVKNDKGWEVKKLGKVTKFIDYRGKTPPSQNSGILLITAKNIGKKHFKEEPIEYISRDLYEKRMTRGFPKANDVMFVTEGATMGFVCRVPRNIKVFAVGQRLITLVCKDELKEEYLHYFIYDRMFQEEVSRRSTGSSAKGIRASELKQIEILVPPISLQNIFAGKVEAIEKQKQLMEDSLKLMKDNYNSLMQRAFKGELF